MAGEASPVSGEWLCLENGCVWGMAVSGEWLECAAGPARLPERAARPKGAS